MTPPVAVACGVSLSLMAPPDRRRSGPPCAFVEPMMRPRSFAGKIATGVSVAPAHPITASSAPPQFRPERAQPTAPLARSTLVVASTARRSAIFGFVSPPAPRGSGWPGHHSRGQLTAGGLRWPFSLARPRLHGAFSAPARDIAALGRISTADAIRFDMLKNEATAPTSQMSRSLKPAERRAVAVALADQMRRLRQLHRESRAWRGGAPTARRRDSSSPSARPSTGSPESWRTAAPWAVRQ